jgi:phosphoglycerate dehydrogenase-like enzyme
MAPLNVLVIAPFLDVYIPPVDDVLLGCIATAAPGINVRDASSLAHAELQGDAAAFGKLDVMLAEADIIFAYSLPPDIMRRAPRLKWVQMMSAGVDRLLGTDLWQSPLMITGVSGISAGPVAEFAIMFMLMFVKDAPRFFMMKRDRKWERYRPSSLNGKTVGIVGLGNIGREVARLSGAFGMNVVATRRSAGKETHARYVDRLLPLSQLHSLLAASNFVVISVPLTPDTRNLIGEREFRAMKPSACIINIARGGIIDEDALIRALDEKRIAGAGLDVTAAEPLPPDSRLWEFDNVIISPHVAGGAEEYMERATRLFCDNLDRYINGRRLKNIVDRKRGY